VEEQLETLLQLGHDEGRCEKQVEDSWAVDTPITSYFPIRASDPQVREFTDQLSSKPLSERAGLVDNASSSLEISEAFAEDAGITKSRYLQKTPFTCEEDRPPLTDPKSHSQPTRSSEIPRFLEYYLEHACPMYPVMCDPSAHAVSGSVVVQGIGEDIESYFTLLIVALSKAYENDEALESGASDFRRATQLFSKLSVQFSLKHVQVHVLSAIFLLKKGRLLGFWSSLHAGCTILYTMIRR
jgi:hypothetical protein